MTFYIQLKNDGDIITDIINYEKDGYQQISAPLPLPNGLLGGWYRYADNQFVFDEELYHNLNTPRVSETESMGE